MKIAHGEIPTDEGHYSSLCNRFSLWSLIAHWPFPFDTNYLSYKLGWESEFGQLAIQEYRRFAYMALQAETELTPSIAVDEVWHVHILHTRDYQKFAVACGTMLHHSPGMPAQAEVFNRQYLYTLATYREVFAEEPPCEVWLQHSKSEETNQGELI